MNLTVITKRRKTFSGYSKTNINLFQNKDWTCSIKAMFNQVQQLQIKHFRKGNNFNVQAEPQSLWNNSTYSTSAKSQTFNDIHHHDPLSSPKLVVNMIKQALFNRANQCKNSTYTYTIDEEFVEFLNTLVNCYDDACGRNVRFLH